MFHWVTSRRSRFPPGAAALLLLVAGCASPAVNNAGHTETPTPSRTASSPAEAPAVPGPATAEASGAALAMDASKPVRFAIPALDRTGEIIETGLREDNTLEVPPEHEGAPASWYTGSPSPGQLGPSVLLGHVNSTEDESGIFYNLKTLQNGDPIEVTREDGSIAIFSVYKSELYPKNDFPTKAVYFPVGEAELRVITCDGFTESSGKFVENLVVYAKLVDTK